MQLSYPGKTYTAQSHSVEPEENPQVSHVLGKTHSVRQFTVAQRHTVSCQTYRGVHYSV